MVSAVEVSCGRVSSQGQRFCPSRAHSEVRDGRARMILRQVRLVAPRLARRLSARTLDTPFISDSIPVRARLVG